MKKKDILEFVEKHAPVDNVRVVYGWKLGDDETLAYVDYKRRRSRLVYKTLHVNRSTFSRCLPELQKAVLLHELGHFTVTKINENPLREYKAHVWAYKKAKEHNWKKIEQQIVKLAASWKTSKWNEQRGDWRTHIIAARMFENYLKRLRKKKCSSRKK